MAARPCRRPAHASASGGAATTRWCSASHDIRDYDPSRPCRAAAVERRLGPRLAALPAVALDRRVLPLPRPADPVAQPDQPGRRAVGRKLPAGDDDAGVPADVRHYAADLCLDNGLLAPCRLPGRVPSRDGAPADPGCPHHPGPDAVLDELPRPDLLVDDPAR